MGDTVTVRLWSDAAGRPSVLLNDFATSITAADADGVGADPNSRRVLADFASPPAPLAGTTCWIGMSGTGCEPGQQVLDASNAAQDGSFYRIGGTTRLALVPAGDMAFRPFGDATPAAIAPPGPGTPMLAATGLQVAFGFWLRRRRKVAAARAGRGGR